MPRSTATRGHSGSVEITGGELDVADHYVRIGTGGATGTVIQSGGTFSSSGAIDLAWKSTDSLGIYKLSGGTLAAQFLNIGTQGRGEFEMTGGSVLGQTLVVGMAFLSVPSVGVMNQTGGTVDVKNVKVGDREAAVGGACRATPPFWHRNPFRWEWTATGRLSRAEGWSRCTGCSTSA